MAMQMLLSRNIEDVTPKGEFRLEAYLHVFTRHFCYSIQPIALQPIVEPCYCMCIIEMKKIFTLSE